MTIVSKRPRKLGAPCETTWRIADRESALRGRKATSEEVVAAAAADGVRETTARSEYARWSREFDLRPTAGPAPSDAPVVDPGVQLVVADNGRIVIPKELRALMALGPDGIVTARLVDGELRLISPRAAVARAQRRLAHLKRPGESIVDEFLAERRAMWGEE